MKLITATVKITRDTLVSSTFSPRTTVQTEVLHRLRKVFEEARGYSVTDDTWNTLEYNVVETRTVHRLEDDIWVVTAQMLVPEETTLFEEME